MKKYCQDKGFTIAEVLITLTIIAVIATFVIPSLYNYIQDTQFRNMLQKKYAVLQEAISLIAKNEQSTNIKAYLPNYINVKQNGVPELNDFPWFGTNFVKTYDGASSLQFADLNGSPYAMILQDGSLLLIRNQVASCVNYKAPAFCAALYIDLNGMDKAPNRTGKDFFSFYLIKSASDVYTLYPGGAPFMYTTYTNGVWVHSSNTKRCLISDPYSLGCTYPILNKINIPYSVPADIRNQYNTLP